MTGADTDINREKEWEAENRALIVRLQASIEVTKAIAAFPDNAQPVLDLIVRRVRELTKARTSDLVEYDGTLLHQRAWDGFEPEAVANLLAAFPRPPGPETTPGMVVLSGEILLQPSTEINGLNILVPERQRQMGASLGVPLLREGRAIGALTLSWLDPGEFDQSRIELMRSFAEQAVIAIETARLVKELRERTAALDQRDSDFGERIGQQAATIDVLKVMSASPGDPQPVFDLIAERARLFCRADTAAVGLLNGDMLHLRAQSGAIDGTAEFPRPVSRDSMFGRAILSRAAVQISDAWTDPDHRMGLNATTRSPLRSVAAVPLLRAGEPAGAIFLGQVRPGGFTSAQMELLQTFSEQAAIAIGSAETYHALQERTAALAQRNNDFGERIEQQAATIDVLKVMSSNPDDTQPIFDLIVRRAAELCGAAASRLMEFDGTLVYPRSSHGITPVQNAPFLAMFPMHPNRDSAPSRAILEQRIIHIRDADADPELSGSIRATGRKSLLAVPLFRDDAVIGAIMIAAVPPGGFTESQVALLQTFAEQAVIAIGSVATFRALRERTAELTRSVAELNALEEVLRAVNSSLDLATVLQTIISRAVRLSQADEGTIYEFNDLDNVFVPKSAVGMTAERVAALRDRRIRLGETPLGRAARDRTPVNVDDVQLDPATPDPGGLLAGIHSVLAVPLLKGEDVLGGLVIRRRTEGGFPLSTVTLMQTFAGQCVLAIENARLFQEAGRARSVAETALTDLRRTQDRLVQTEKLASLGQLTAGIAHEIKNPLNFVNNFAELSSGLVDELLDAVSPEKMELAADLRAEIDDISITLKGNLEKIAHHGNRADRIVKNMLLHSRTGVSEHRPVDVNAAVEDALNLAYHGARAENQSFNITMLKELDLKAGSVEAYPQEFTRVMLNLISNGFYAAHQRKIASPDFDPILTVSTKDLGDHVRINVRDNGAGIPENARDRIFEPFFTTKPAGEGTGLGLSLSHDIVVKQHGGQLTVDSQIDEFTEFSIALPRRMAAGGKA